jgi:hypothetical protein
MLFNIYEANSQAALCSGSGWAGPSMAPCLKSLSETVLAAERRLASLLLYSTVSHQ